MKQLLIIVLVFLSIRSVSLAQVNIDSLNGVWNDESQPDTTRFKAMKIISWDGYLFTNPDTAYTLLDELIELAKSKGNKKWEARALNIQGVSFIVRGNFSLALDHDLRSLKLYTEINFKEGMAHNYNDIGVIYKNLEQPPKALEYFTKALEIRFEIGANANIPSSYNNIGVIYSIQGKNQKALEFFKKAIDFAEQIEDKEEMINPLYNAADESYLMGDTVMALKFINRSFRICKDLNQAEGITSAFRFLGTLYFDQGKIPEAIDYANKSLKLAQEIGYIKGIMEAATLLKDIYKLQEKGLEALEMYELEIQMSDSIQSEEAKMGLIKMEVEHEFEKREILAEQAHQKEMYQKNQTRNYLAGGFIFALLLSGGILSRLHYVRKSKTIVEKEKDRANNLLLNILPADVAEELKINGKAEARDFDMASILFTDFKGFTAAAENLSAQDLVSEINTCFEAFDGIMGNYNIEKIKTIGDAYMAAGGLPVPNNDSVKNTVLAALEMQSFISSRKAQMDKENKPAFEMRVGIHTGPVVAGIVGIKKFQYDIWGDTVNTASRMESNGEVGKVNISQATYELLKNDSDFKFESRGKIEAKGKGEMEMYFVSLNQE